MPTNPAPQRPQGADAVPLRPLLTERQAAEFLAVSPRTLQAWRVKGGGPSFLKIGASVRYAPADLSAWIADQNRTNTSDNGPAAA